MPTLNQAPYIEQAVHSVLTQDVPGLELVVADGGSTDGTPQILDRLAQAHPGLIRWHSQADGGPAQAVNAAVARARGEVIGWLNSDDLYTPGAAARALAWLQQHPQAVMVYGEGEHIDRLGAVTGRYPTRPPRAPLAEWADGCHLCQPTAFFRRGVFLALGGLDEGLRTAFDYEFWLRLLKAHTGAVGLLPQVQAQSRLHDQGITLRLREQVALEALQVIHRHIGPAPGHWLLTHFEEVMAGLPFDTPPGASQTPTRRLQQLVNQARPWLNEADFAGLHAHIRTHKALQLAGANLFAAVHADGWAGPQLEIRLHATPQQGRTLLLRGRHAHPLGIAQRLQAHVPGQAAQLLTLSRPGPFTWRLPLPPGMPDEPLRCSVHCSECFVPAAIEPGSTDRRELAFLLDELSVMLT